MKISIFTPSHNPQFLDRAHRSIIQQTLTGASIEWIVLLNNDARSDSRGPKWAPRDISPPWLTVTVHSDETGNKNIGWLKRLACEMCSGDVLVELDHDDELLPDCLAWIAGTADPEKAQFLWSPTWDVRGTYYGNAYGWEHATYKGHTYNVPFEVSPRSLCEIYYAPNHVRAWTRKAYEAAGRHDLNMECGDDHDLIIRTYLAGAQFIMARLPLYKQHFMAGMNSQHDQARFDRIQKQSAANRDKYLTPLVHEWCKRNSLAMLDLGGAFNCPEGYIPVDVLPCDGGLLWNVEKHGIPVVDHISNAGLGDFAGIGCIRAKDFLEHIRQPFVVGVMNQIHKRLEPGGWLLTLTPSTDGRGAWQDPTHVSFWNENSWLYYTQHDQAKYVPAITARFQAVQIGTGFPGDWERERNIPYVQANLCALHGQRQPGLIGFPRESLLESPGLAEVCRQTEPCNTMSPRPASEAL